MKEKLEILVKLGMSYEDATKFCGEIAEDGFEAGQLNMHEGIIGEDGFYFDNWFNDKIKNVIKEDKNKPYFTIIKVETELKYNPDFGDDRICECGHTYYRHFDSYEHMDACGCKYCECYIFKEKK
jgi:hypothetical protein